MYEENLDALFGTRAVIEAIKAKKEIDKVLIQDGLRNDLVRELIFLLKDNNIPYNFVPRQKLDRFEGKNHQGVMAFVASITYHNYEYILEENISKENVVLLILDKVTDVRNFGAISRTALCMGVSAIIIPEKGSAQINADAVKTSAGALNFIPICREHNLKAVIEDLVTRGFKMVAATEKAANSMYQEDLTGNIAIIMGNEEQGVSNEYLKRCNLQVKIPISGPIESLNVSVATGMILSEVLRQNLKA